VRGCRKASRPRNQRRRTCSNLNKLHRFCRVSGIAVFIVSLSLFSLPLLAQASYHTVGADAPGDPRDSDVDGSHDRSPSHYVVSVNRLRIPVKAANRLEAAQLRFAKMQLAEASMEVDRAIDIYPEFAQAFCMKALVALAERDFKGSVESAAHAIRLDGADAYSWVALATAYNSLNEWPEAEAAAAQALSLDPAAWQGRLELAKSFYGEAKLDLALSTLDQLNQDIPDVHLVRANSLIRLGRPQEAAQQFAVFLREAPGDSRRDQIRRIASQIQAKPGPE
jgi:tetratricopeptide (TPR) repeat protein